MAEKKQTPFLPFMGVAFAALGGVFLYSVLKRREKEAFQKYLKEEGRSLPHEGEEEAFLGGIRWQTKQHFSRLRLANAADKYWKEVLESCAELVEKTNPNISTIGKAVTTLNLARLVTGSIGKEKLKVEEKTA